MNDYMTIKETAEKWDVTERWVQTLCAKEKIDGALKFGGVWAIPKDAERPNDGRIKSGRYKDWRKREIP